MDIKQIDEKIKELESYNKELSNSVNERENQSFDEDELATFDANEQEIESLKLQRATQERIHNYSNRKDVVKAIRKQPVTFNKQDDEKQDYDKAMRAFLTKDTEHFNEDWGQAAERVGVNYRQSKFNITLPYSDKFTQSLTNGAGGHTVNESVVLSFEKALKAYWSWADVVDVIRTSNGEPKKIPILNDTGKVAVYIDELDPAVNNSLAFGTPVTLGAHRLGTAAMPISHEIAVDSQIDILSVIGDCLGERVGRAVSDEVTNGDGQTGHLTGFASQTTAGATSIYDDGFEYADIIKLYWALGESYKANAKWMMHSQTMAFLMTFLMDDFGRPLFMPFNDPIHGGPRYQLLGHEIVINDNLPACTPGTAQPGVRLVYFGDFKKVKVRMVRDITISTSYEKYWDSDAIAMKATVRLDSNYVNAGTNPLIHLATGTPSGGLSILDAGSE
jgi:HK97 family phage major capsid protein